MAAAPRAASANPGLAGDAAAADRRLDAASAHSAGTMDEAKMWQSLWAYVDTTLCGGGAALHAELKRPVSRALRRVRRMETDSLCLACTSWISSLQLILWDNVTGPRIDALWVGPENIAPEVHHDIAKTALAGSLEIQNQCKFIVLPHEWFVVSSIFGAPYQGTLTKYALVLVARKNHLARYLLIHKQIQSRLQYLVLLVRMLLSKEPEQLQPHLARDVNSFAWNAEQLFTAGISDWLDPQADPLDELWRDSRLRQFVVKAVTSSLQTHGCVVVVGKQPSLINKLVNAFSLFMNDKERAVSGMAGAEECAYTPGLLLQGVWYGACAQHRKVGEDQLVQALLPSTVVDTDNFVVYQTVPYHTFVKQRQRHFRDALRRFADAVGKSLAAGTPSPLLQVPLSTTPKVPQTPPGSPAMMSPSSPGPSDAHSTAAAPLREPAVAPGSGDLWRGADFIHEPPASPLVGNIMGEVMCVPSRLRAPLVRAHMRLLYRYAATLILTMSGGGDNSANASGGSGNGAAVGDATARSQRVMGLLGLKSTCDLAVIVGMAERLCPGAYGIVFTSNLYELEQAFIEIFDGI
eukprot:TRINITY_DN2888_c0_g1_i1.p1 TRINITY_DN2888_c0_g1~~TRINITY_DN2888_c0_g1_i1.p1  ORF type:complete len:589 (+),score=145.14 TRINITY_DN2888_c0_g1_i1:38-1768(+)